MENALGVVPEGALGLTKEGSVDLFFRLTMHFLHVNYSLDFRYFTTGRPVCIDSGIACTLLCFTLYRK
jgi:hypothetical protein